MILTLGNPQMGVTVELEFPNDAEAREIQLQTENALRVLRAATKSARSYTLKHETAEEKRARLATEEYQEAQLATMEVQTKKMREMLG